MALRNETIITNFLTFISMLYSAFARDGFTIEDDRFKSEYSRN